MRRDHIVLSRAAGGRGIWRSQAGWALLFLLPGRTLAAAVRARGSYAAGTERSRVDAEFRRRGRLIPAEIATAPFEARGVLCAA